MKPFHFEPKLEDELRAIKMVQQALRGRYVLVITPVAVEAYDLWDPPNEIRLPGYIPVK